jgi:hypothetical protein
MSTVPRVRSREEMHEVRWAAPETKPDGDLRLMLARAICGGQAPDRCLARASAEAADMKPRRVLEEALVPVQVVAPYPATITQRSCFEWFGISKADFLRLVSRGAFPFKAEGQLRIARFADVEAYLTAGTEKRSPAPRAEAEPDPVANFDRAKWLHSKGFRKG